MAPTTPGRPRHRRPGARPAVGALLAVCGLLASCAEPPGSGPDVPVDGFAGFPACEGLPTIAAGADLYRDEPRYGNATDLVEEVRAWASGVPGFAELWLDRDRNGWLHVGFHGADVEALQEDVAQRFPGEGVVVVEVPHTAQELETLAGEVAAALGAAGAGPAGHGADVHRGVAAVHGVPGTPEAHDALLPFAGEPLCVDATPTAEIVPEGEQPAGGDGWRLLGHEQGAGSAFRTALATTDEQLGRLWSESGLPGPVPQVAWDREVVVWFGAVWGSGCPVRLDDVVVDGDTLHADLVVPGSGPSTACAGDANPHAFVVAVERSRLPAGPFVVQLAADDPPPGAPEERTVVDVDLSEPRAVASDAQLHADPQAGPQPGPVVEDGHPGMPENGARYLWQPRPECSDVVIGPFDGSLWRRADGEAGWTEADGQEVTLHPVDDDLLVVSSPGTEYAFVRVPGTVCDG